jgi:hypothetical protein
MPELDGSYAKSLGLLLPNRAPTGGGGVLPIGPSIGLALVDLEHAGLGDWGVTAVIGFILALIVIEGRQPCPVHEAGGPTRDHVVGVAKTDPQDDAFATIFVPGNTTTDRFKIREVFVRTAITCCAVSCRAVATTVGPHGICLSQVIANIWRFFEDCWLASGLGYGEGDKPEKDSKLGLDHLNSIFIKDLLVKSYYPSSHALFTKQILNT